MIISGYYASPFKAYFLVNRNKFRGSVKDFSVDKDILVRSRDARCTSKVGTTQPRSPLWERPLTTSAAKLGPSVAR